MRHCFVQYTIFSLVFLTLCFVNNEGHSQELNKAKAHVSAVISVYDGDTFRADIEGVGKYLAVRVAGVDTPEIKGRCPAEIQLALKARDLTASLLRAASSIELRNLRRGYYGRIVAQVRIDGQDLAAILIEHGVGRRYVSGGRGGWCHG